MTTQPKGKQMRSAKPKTLCIACWLLYAAGCAFQPPQPLRTPAIHFEPADLTSNTQEYQFRISAWAMFSESQRDAITNNIYVEFPGEAPESLAALVSVKKLDLTLDDRSPNVTHYDYSIPSMRIEGWISIWLENPLEHYSVDGTALPNGRTGIRFNPSSSPVISQAVMVRKQDRTDDRLEVRLSEAMDASKADALDARVGTEPCAFMPEASGASIVSYQCTRADEGETLSFGPKAGTRSKTGRELGWFEGGSELRSFVIESGDLTVGEIYPGASN